MTHPHSRPSTIHFRPWRAIDRTWWHHVSSTPRLASRVCGVRRQRSAKGTRGQHQVGTTGTLEQRIVQHSQPHQATGCPGHPCSRPPRKVAPTEFVTSGGSKGRCAGRPPTALVRKQSGQPSSRPHGFSRCDAVCKGPARWAGTPRTKAMTGQHRRFQAMAGRIDKGTANCAFRGLMVVDASRSQQVSVPGVCADRDVGPVVESAPPMCAVRSCGPAAIGHLRRLHIVPGARAWIAADNSRHPAL